MIILGIDPGAVSGAWGELHHDTQACGDLAVVDRMVDASWLAKLVGAIPRPDAVVVEKVNAFPGQGVSSSFRFGTGYGIILGVTAATGVPLMLVSPAKWKKHFGLDRDKEKSRALALRRFPRMGEFLSHKKDAGRAEALLMALWYLETKP